MGNQSFIQDKADEELDALFLTKVWETLVLCEIGAKGSSDEVRNVLLLPVEAVAKDAWLD